jgi:hypothetical protein
MIGNRLGDRADCSKYQYDLPLHSNGATKQRYINRKFQNKELSSAGAKHNLFEPEFREYYK